MNAVLTRLGVSAELQAFLNLDELQFCYGDDREYFDIGFHIVPTTTNIWLAGSEAATNLIISSSAMNAIAYLCLHSHQYPDLAKLTLLSLGNLPHPAQLKWIRTRWQKRKITLVFNNDLTGRVCDIMVAMGVRGKVCRFRWSSGQVSVWSDSLDLEFNPERLTLNSFQKSAGIRTGIRTRKPSIHNTYLDQLKDEHYK
jgi:hypothetical protein